MALEHDDDRPEALPEAVPRWRAVYDGGRRLGTLANCGPGSAYVFYACEPNLVVFDGCNFSGPREAETVLVRAARRFRATGADPETGDGDR